MAVDGTKALHIANCRRDPRQTSHDGDALLTFLQRSELPVTLASLNYRLSPWVCHPAHVDDIIAALTFLQGRHGMKEFVLVGHSAGACLAFQTSHVSGCKGIVGAEGIYDLVELVQEYPKYEDMIEGAFGNDKSRWHQASPTHIMAAIVDLSHLTVLLIQSTEDQLLSSKQTELMSSVLQRTNVNLYAIARTRGTHDSSITTPDFCTIVYNFIAHILKT